MTIHRLAVLFKPSTNANNKKKNSKEVINCRKNIKKPEYLCSIIKTKKSECNTQHGHFKTHFT